MSILSMTGFGQSSFELGSVNYQVSVKTVNNRFLDLKLRLPQSLNNAELEVRARISKALERGRVDMSLQSAPIHQTDSQVLHYDSQAALAAKNELCALAEKLGLTPSDDTLFREILRSPSVTLSDTEAQDALEPKFFEALDIALKNLLEMRAKEGEALRLVLCEMLDRMENLRLQLIERASVQVANWRERLLTRLRDYLEQMGQRLDESRLVQEVALVADKTDVAEELARLKSHISQGKQLLKAEGPAQRVGRKLDFLCQEMLREVTTTASKVQDLEATEITLTFKSELERFREQIQNVE